LKSIIQFVFRLEVTTHLYNSYKQNLWKIVWKSYY